jgi:hypothetical protein
MRRCYVPVIRMVVLVEMCCEVERYGGLLALVESDTRSGSLHSIKLFTPDAAARRTVSTAPPKTTSFYTDHFNVIS